MRWAPHDRGSQNGTRVREMICTGRAELHDGDRIHIGPVAMVFRKSAAGMSTETMPLPAR